MLHGRFCAACCGVTQRRAAPIERRPHERFRWSFENEGTTATCYALVHADGPRWELRPVGSIRYEPGNWLSRLLWPNRWRARAGFSVGRFRYQYEAQMYVQDHAEGLP